MIIHHGCGFLSDCFVKKTKRNDFTLCGFRVTCKKCIAKLGKTAKDIKTEVNLDPYALRAVFILGLVIGGDVHNPIFTDDQTLEKNYQAIAKKTKELL